MLDVGKIGITDRTNFTPKDCMSLPQATTTPQEDAKPVAYTIKTESNNQSNNLGQHPPFDVHSFETGYSVPKTPAVVNEHFVEISEQPSQLRLIFSNMCTRTCSKSRNVVHPIFRFIACFLYNDAFRYELQRISRLTTCSYIPPVSTKTVRSRSVLSFILALTAIQENLDVKKMAMWRTI